MPSVDAPDAPILAVSAQPVLRIGEERCALLPGTHGLGGRAPDAITLATLESQPRAATLTVLPNGTTLLQRTTASIMVRIDGETIGIAAVQLFHGCAIEFGDCRLSFETDAIAAPNGMRTTGERASFGATTGGARPLSLVAAGARPSVEMHARNDAQQGVSNAALIVERSGARHPLPPRRIYIGRDDTCDVVVQGNSVSRRHASISPVVGGFMLRDESVNGTLVNGVRVVGTYLLGNGDVVKVQDEELRIELDASAPKQIAKEAKTTMLDLSHITRGVTEERAREVVNRVPTASLEIVRGPFSGASFQVERAVCSIGRGEDNDVRIRDDTVSLTHATLLRKRGAWFVVDLRSMNGTFVDGSRVSGERELHPGTRVRVGAVELVFRAIDVDTAAPAEPPRRGLWMRLREVLRTVAPPGASA
jgi:pSer/pThr/pTyr-binding forkhead associated (FHA) protein